MKVNLVSILLFCTVTVNATVTLPAFFSDNMVLQRNVQIPVWGSAKPNEKIQVKFHNQTKKTVADAKGNWILKLDAEKAGGPYLLNITGENKVVIKNVLVGEVWLCSGQSNMEFQVRNSLHAQQEITSANYPNIRHIKIGRAINSMPQTEIESGKWEVCDSNTVKDFSAVAFFFAQKLFKEIHVPIGLINSSWGGTNIETWISREGFESSDEFKKMIAKMPKVAIDSLNKINTEQAVKKIESVQRIPFNSFNEKAFLDISFDDSKLPTLYQPKAWEEQSLANFDGVVWIRKTIELTEAELNQPAVLYLSKIDDEDVTYINGGRVGGMNIWDAERKYVIAPGILHAGKNVIAVKIIDNGGGGGMWGDPENVKLVLGSQHVSLSGDWKFQVEKIKSGTNENSYPSLCYNAMIAPLIPYAIKGVLWYQGESNVDRAFQYRKAFPLLIQDWRKKWLNEFPFYFVQLATYETPGNSNVGSPWAELREAQTLTLQVPKTGMVVTTDVGNPTNLHPINKQSVGQRLAALALNNDYKKPMICNSPMYTSMEVKNNKVVVAFNNTNTTLAATDKIKGFEIAGNDQIFHPATAKIIYGPSASARGNKVLLESVKVARPVAVRFGWKGDASECNLFNAEGLPLVPFRTDDWKTITLDMRYHIME